MACVEKQVNATNNEENVTKLMRFIENFEVKKLHAIGQADVGETFIVGACFETVAEGVDLWFNNSGAKALPRYRIKLGVYDENDSAIFHVFDDIVERIAAETCALLLAMNESATLHPHSIGFKAGEAVVFKVKKVAGAAPSTDGFFQVLEFCNDFEIVDLFFEKYRADCFFKVCSVGDEDDCGGLKIDVQECVDAIVVLVEASPLPSVACMDTAFVTVAAKRKLDFCSEEASNVVGGRNSKVIKVDN